MAPKDLDKLIEKYLAGNCTQEERDFIDACYSALGQEMTGTGGDGAAERISSAEDRIAAQIREHTRSVSTEPPEEIKHHSLFWHYTGIAASLLIFLAAGFYFLKPDKIAPRLTEQNSAPDFNNISNTTAASRRVILPDGSIVVMSPESRIRFPNGTEAPSRELFLEGEAYFDVAHDPSRPFYVYAGNVITKVLGTSFIIRNRSHEKVTVSVKTGKVTVYSRQASHKKTVLTPNQEAVYDQATDLVATQPVPVQRLKEEKLNFNEMHFEETPVSEVLAALTKTYDIDIVFPEETLAGCVLTSSFYEEGLYDRIDVICTAIGAVYKIVDAQIVIESKGCNLKTN